MLEEFVRVENLMRTWIEMNYFAGDDEQYDAVISIAKYRNNRAGEYDYQAFANVMHTDSAASESALIATSQFASDIYELREDALTELGSMIDYEIASMNEKKSRKSKT